MGGEAKLVEGEGLYLADRDLKLPYTLETKKYGLSATVVWQSGNENVISSAGVLNYPEIAGELVTMRAYLISGNTILSEKEFGFFVKAANPSTAVLRVKGDQNPTIGSGKAADTTYVADGAYNSIIYDKGSVQKINRVNLNSINSIFYFFYTLIE